MIEAVVAAKKTIQDIMHYKTFSIYPSEIDWIFGDRGERRKEIEDNTDTIIILGKSKPNVLYFCVWGQNLGL